MRRYDIALGRVMPPPQFVKEREGAVIQLQRQDEGLFAVYSGGPYWTVTSVR